MVVHRHKLTVDADTVNGGKESDLLLAPLQNGSATLNGTDVLNGGRGTDTIRATLAHGAIAPVMKNIERGIFTIGNVSETHLDLLNALQMRSLTFLQNAVHSSETGVYVENAARMRSLSIENADNSAYHVSGLDTSSVHKLNVSFSDVIATTLDLQSSADAPYGTLTIDLAGGTDVYLSGNCVAAENVIIHSDGGDKNKLSLNPATGSDAISSLTISGSQNVSLYNVSGAYLHLTSFDSTAMSGITWVTIGGSELQTV